MPQTVVVCVIAPTLPRNQPIIIHCNFENAVR